MTTQPRGGSGPAPPDTVARHLWQFQAVRDVMIVAVVFGLLWLGHAVRLVTVPLLLAVLLAYLFEPLIKRVTRVKWVSRQGAAAAIIAVAAIGFGLPLVVGVGYGGVQAFQFTRGLAVNLSELPDALTKRDLSQLPEGWRPFGVALLKADEEWRDIVEKEPQFVGPPREGEDWPQDQRGALARAASALATALQENAEFIATRLGQSAVNTGADALAAGIALLRSATLILFGGFLTAFFFFFTSTAWGRVLGFWAGMIPQRKRGRAFDLLAKMDRVIAAFVRGRLTIAAILALLFTIAYWIIGVPTPLILGLVVGVLSIVPYLPLIGIPLSILLLILEPTGEGVRAMWWWKLGAPVMVYVVIQATDDYIWTPLIQGKATDLDSPTILFAVLAGGALAGFYGVLVAIPVAACAKILLKELVYPRVKAWAAGKAADPLPIGEG